MIELLNLCKSFPTPSGPKIVADNISAVFPRKRAVALLGRNGAGKSTLLQIIAGNIAPDRGEVRISGQVSYPVGFAGSFHRDLTGAQNTRFVARIYGVDTDGLVHFVKDFAGLGAHFNMPVRQYSSGMKSRLAFGISMGIRFDTYLVDEVTSVGDVAFRKKSALVFKERMTDAGAIVVSHSVSEVRRLCDMAAVLDRGRLTMFDDVDEAIAHHHRLMEGAD
jgi:capsular polysaccharide transport system ATP-binding protein